MEHPRLVDTEQTSTLALCFLAEGSGAGVGLLGAMRATGLLAEPSSDDETDGQLDPARTASS